MSAVPSCVQEAEAKKIRGSDTPDFFCSLPLSTTSEIDDLCQSQNAETGNNRYSTLAFHLVVGMVPELRFHNLHTSPCTSDALRDSHRDDNLSNSHSSSGLCVPPGKRDSGSGGSSDHGWHRILAPQR